MPILSDEKRIISRFRKILRAKEEIVLPNGEVLDSNFSSDDRYKIFSNFVIEVIFNETNLDDYEAIDSCIYDILVEYPSLYPRIVEYEDNHHNYRKNRDFNKRLKEKFIEALDNGNTLKATAYFTLREKVKTLGESKEAIAEREKIENKLSIFSKEYIELQELASKLPTENYILQEIEDTIALELPASIQLSRKYLCKILLEELKLRIKKPGIIQYASMKQEDRKEMFRVEMEIEAYERTKLVEKIVELALENYTSEEIWDYLDKNLY